MNGEIVRGNIARIRRRGERGGGVGGEWRDIGMRRRRRTRR